MRRNAHPAGDGLMGSGRVVCLLDADTPLQVRPDRAMAVVLLEVPGRPCGALLGFTSGAAVRFAEHLRTGFERLCGNDHTSDAPILTSLPTYLATLAIRLDPSWSGTTTGADTDEVRS